MPRPSLMPLCTQVRGIEILRSSPFGDSANFALTEFYEVRSTFVTKIPKYAN
jgi:hypothetical protein